MTNLAPNIADLNVPPAAAHGSRVKKPSIDLIGCGGCGINILSKFVDSGKKFDRPFRMFAYDTSEANWDAKDQPASINFSLIGGGDGSGMDRKRNAGPINEFFDNHQTIVNNAADISIIICGMGGGSGSVIAPLLVDRLLRRSTRAVVVVAIGNNSSLGDASNTSNTLKSFSNLAQTNKYYTPIMLFENWSHGRKATDTTVLTRLTYLVDLLTNNSISELDYEDRMRFLRPDRNGCPCGCYLLTVDAHNYGEDTDLPGETKVNMRSEEYMCHTAMFVNDSGLVPRLKTSAAYVGISDDVTFFSAVGIPIPPDYINELNVTGDQYGRTAIATDTTNTTLEGFDAKVDKSGMVF